MAVEYIHFCLQAGDVIFVHGASGGVGSALMQLAAWKQIEAVGTAGSPAGLDFVQNLGGKKVYDHSKDDYVSQLKKDYPKGLKFLEEQDMNMVFQDSTTSSKWPHTRI